MGTRGYYVYRYRNIYFVYESSSDSYPRRLGVKMLRTMRQPNAISKERQRFGEILDSFPDPENPPDPDDSDPDDSGLEDSGCKNFYEGLDFIAQKDRPRDCVWIYEIDLDHNIFHIDGMPFFSLECLPKDKEFPKFISTDNYGKIACAEACPPKYRYKRPAPPAVDDSDLAAYKSLECGGTDVPLLDLLNISGIMTPNERVRMSLLEIMIGQCMVRPHHHYVNDWPDVSQVVRDIEIAFDHNQLTDQEWLIACSMANLAFIPQIFDTPCKWIFHRELKRKEFTWVREDIVVRIATHLDDERCLHSCISRLIDEILEQKDNPGDYYGVAFSVYHCAIVKVVKDAHKTMFSHTVSLQFLPSLYAESPSTPGIVALASLGYRVDPALFERTVDICGWLGSRFTAGRTRSKQLLTQGDDDPPPANALRRAALPCELWREVALHLRFYDLMHFGFVSKLFREVASMVFRYPHVSGYRLLATPAETPDNMLEKHRFLQAAFFFAVRGGISATVLVGFGDRDGDYVTLPFGNDYSPRVGVSVTEATQGVEDKE